MLTVGESYVDNQVLSHTFVRKIPYTNINFEVSFHLEEEFLPPT